MKDSCGCFCCLLSALSIQHMRNEIQKRVLCARREDTTCTKIFGVCQFANFFSVPDWRVPVCQQSTINYYRVWVCIWTISPSFSAVSRPRSVYTVYKTHAHTHTHTHTHRAHVTMHIHVHIHLGFHRGANLPVYSGLPFQFETFKSLSKTQVLKHTQVFVIVFLKHVMHDTFPEFRTRLSTPRSTLHLRSMRDQLLFTIHQYPFNMEPCETVHYHTMEPHETQWNLTKIQYWCLQHECFSSILLSTLLFYSDTKNVKWHPAQLRHLPVMFVFGICVCVQKRSVINMDTPNHTEIKHLDVCR